MPHSDPTPGRTGVEAGATADHHDLRASAVRAIAESQRLIGESRALLSELQSLGSGDVLPFADASPRSDSSAPPLR